jgi:dihydrofolate reductase
MSKVIYAMSASLDGFVVAQHATAKEPLGRNGEFLHQWVFDGGPENAAFFGRMMEDVGAVIAGRKTYDDSLPFWDDNGPTGEARLPLFVVTHRPLEKSHNGGVYHEVRDGVVSALAEARLAAGKKGVSIMGGNVATQLIAKGLVDEIVVSTVPVLFGGGTPMFAALGDEVKLEPIETVSTALANHVRYRVVR